MAVVDVAGLAVGYDRCGTGPPLVLLHGAVCDRRVWRAELEQLADEFTVIAWDAPGCGESSDPPEDFGLADYAECLARLLAELEVSRPHLVGHSWGGGLALQTGVSFPRLAASLILVGGYAGWAGSLPPEEVAHRLDAMLALTERMPDFDPHAIRGLFSERIPPARAAELADVMADARAVGTRVMARAFAETDLRDALGDLGVPTLLLYGSADERAPRAVAEALHAAVADSTLVVVPGLGHELVLESPAVFTTAVRSFVGGLRSGARRRGDDDAEPPSV